LNSIIPSTPVSLIKPGPITVLPATSSEIEAAPSMEAEHWAARFKLARDVARSISDLYGGAAAYFLAAANLDTVTVTIRPHEGDTAAWEYYLRELSVSSVEVRGWFLVGDGVFGGWPVRVVGDGLVESLPQRSAVA
jgi:hypothetical protein